MIKHIVCLQFKPNYSETQIQKAVMQFSTLKKSVPAMIHFSFGKNCSPEGLSQGFTHAFTVDFKDLAGRDAYLAHDEHQRIAQEIIPMLKNGVNSAVVIDYEF